jgi:hypothetical protein
MDEVGARRLERARRRLPDVETIVAMFETRLEARFKVVPELVTEARRRIREAARNFGRPVTTTYRKEHGVIFGFVPLTPDEERRLSAEAVQALERTVQERPRPDRRS